MQTIIIFLSILIIICVVIVLIHSSKDNPENQVAEPFGNYQDVKTKTLNWCNKMQKVGLLNPDQFNECVATFNDTSSGRLPKDFKTPQTGMPRNYSLYNTTMKELTSDITGDNTNKIMLSTIDGLTLASKPDNSVYLVANINDPSINQDELYFTLIPQSDDGNDYIYAILSPYGKYLLAGTDYTASFSGTSIGPMASWKITKITSSNNQTADNGNTVLIGSRQFNDFNLVYDVSGNTNPLRIIYGRADNMKWIMTSKMQSTVDNSGNANETYSGAEYYVAKENILQKIKTTNIQKICIQSALATFKNLYNKISNNFDNIANYINKKLTEEQQIFKLSTLDYETRINSINENSMISDVVRANLISTIPPPSGYNITDDDIMVAINKITNYKNTFIQNLQTNVIIPLQQKLIELEGLNLETDYNTFIASLKNDITDTNNRIRQNNIIMNRQKDMYNKINTDYSNHINKEKKIDEVDTIANANIEMINNYSKETSYLNKLYPISIFILAIVLIYVGYITFIKFKENIYMKY